MFLTLGLNVFITKNLEIIYKHCNFALDFCESTLK